MFKIGLLAKKAGCLVETVRYYERIGLMPKPERTQSDHRLYEGGDLKRLQFIRRSRELGFTLQEVSTLLTFVDGSDFSCDEVHVFTVGHIARVRGRITELRSMEKSLKLLAEKCAGGQAPDCPIIDELMAEGFAASNPLAEPDGEA